MLIGWLIKVSIQMKTHRRRALTTAWENALHKDAVLPSSIESWGESTPRSTEAAPKPGDVSSLIRLSSAQLR